MNDLLHRNGAFTHYRSAKISMHHSGGDDAPFTPVTMHHSCGQRAQFAAAYSIKEIEKQMAEITELKKHIINYAKTKEIYTAYRESGYSAKYYELNTESILLHQSAKRAFDSISSDKNLSLRELQLEFNTCWDTKKVKFNDYLLQKKSMKEALTVKSNIDHLFFQNTAEQGRKQR